MYFRKSGLVYAFQPHYTLRTMPTSDDFILDDSAVESSGSAGGSAFDDDDETFVTKEGLKRLKEELDNLKDTRRKEVAQRLKEAISYGDLSENSEYEEAKNEQAFIEGRILELEHKIKSAKLISEKSEGKKMGKEVNIGSTVTIQNLQSDSDKEQAFTIVGATEADPFDLKISNESPIGKALLSKVKGDKVKVPTPSGLVEYEILKVA